MWILNRLERAITSCLSENAGVRDWQIAVLFVFSLVAILAVLGLIVPDYPQS